MRALFDRLSDACRANDVLTSVSDMLRSERRVVTILLIILISFTVYDFFEDRRAGASNEELFEDVSDLFLPTLLLLYIWRYMPLSVLAKFNKLEIDHERRRADLEHWQDKASLYVKGLGESINQQFDRWQLTAAEKEVALLLLKGFSLRELAEMRSVSERTVRQQATSVYSKAGIRGRSELAAFFLEDLMLPTQQPGQSLGAK